MCPGALPASSAPSWLGAHVLSVMSLQDWGVPELGLGVSEVERQLLKGGHVQRPN